MIEVTKDVVKGGGQDQWKKARNLAKDERMSCLTIKTNIIPEGIARQISHPI